ncbi:MAG TPA: asparagine synthase (glutamine-hydrolyzing) [Candidatus Polarisedimenticolia bacterium]|nr:asparagine synthase (glutamine-hydrolyzing) [Candidatus Polarisedimenticolia bacterium]
MCGICGVVALSQDARLPSREAVARMTASLSHRGPDDEGFHFDAGAFLGHRRLSIIDLAGGHQPIPNEDETRFIIFNGEIYNHREVRDVLEKKGHRYRTASDTETILHLTEEEGIPGLNRMNGMWAFAVWDFPRRRLLLARDRLGIKPLYYARVGDLLLFSSEIKSLLASGLMTPELDPAALKSYLDLLYVPAPRTVFKEIKKLPAGHALTADSSGIRIERFWNPDFTLPRIPSLAEAAERVKDLLQDAVRIRLLSEVPLGAFLSGGIDSSLVVGLMHQVMEQPVKTFTVGFRGEGWFDESDEAELVARHFGTEHHALQMTSLDLPDTLEKTVPALDEPMCDPAALPTYLLSKYARQWVTVALTGEGADELFGGYDKYRFERLLGALGPFGSLAGRAGRALPLSRLPERARRAVEAAALAGPARQLRLRSTFAREESLRLLRPSSESFPDASREALDQAARDYPPGDFLNRILYQDLKTYMQDDLLMKIDKMSMLASLEARVPFLDYRLVEFVFSLPSHYKIRGGKGKRILRDAFPDFLPPRIMRRKKHGFVLPISRWLRDDLRDYVRDLFASSDDSFYDYLDRREVERLLREFYDRERDRALPIWVLLWLKIWCRRILRPAGACSGTSA